MDDWTYMRCNVSLHLWLLVFGWGTVTMPRVVAQGCCDVLPARHCCTCRAAAGAHRSAWHVAMYLGSLYVAQSCPDRMSLCLQANEPLAQFMDYCTYGHMIDNVVLIVTGTLHERDVQVCLLWPCLHVPDCQQLSAGC